MTRTTNGIAVVNPLQLLALEDNTLWLFYTRTFADVLIMQGFINGSASYAAGVIQSSSLIDPNNGIGPVSLTGSYSSAGAVLGSGTDPARTIDIVTAKAADSVYNHAAAASLADIAGNWAVTGINGLLATLTITPTGGMSGLMNGAMFTGTLAPRASGRNVFDVTFVINDSLSMLTGVQFKGVAFRSTLANGTSQFIWAGMSANRQYFVGMLGVR